VFVNDEGLFVKHVIKKDNFYGVLLTGNCIIFGWCPGFKFRNTYKSKLRSHAWCNVLDIIGYKKISRRFETSHDFFLSSRKFDRIWNLKSKSGQETPLRNKCCIMKMATSYRLQTSIQGPNCKRRTVHDWHEIIPVSEMEIIIREFFQSDITCLICMCMSLPLNEFSRIVFLHDEIEPLETKLNSWISTFSEKCR
jgi:hypothetical protein